MKAKIINLLFGVWVSIFTPTLVYSQLPPSVTFVGEYTLPTETLFDNIQFGGISGIYYQPDQQRYYAISDARNTPQEGAARFYTLKIALDHKRIQHIDITNMIHLKDEQGLFWTKGSVDAEGLAPTHDGKGLYWVSELGSALRVMDFSGHFVADYNTVIPPYYNVEGISDKTSEFGLRSGMSFEGVSLTPDAKYLFLSAETALKQDGNRSTPLNSSPARLLKYRVNQSDSTLALIGEYIYNIDPIPAVTEFGVNDNGVSDILAIDDHRLLFIERAGRNATAGYSDWDFNIRVYLADLRQSSNLMGIETLSDVKDIHKFQPMTKRLLIDFSDYTNTPDNIEGITFGPVINGHKTLLFVSDNNFQPYQSNKFYFFIDEHNILN